MSKNKAKVFNLSKEEKDRLVAIRNVSNYIIDLLRGDMNMFVDGVIKPRLALVREDNVTVDIDKGTLTTIPVETDPAVEEIKPATEKESVETTPVEPATPIEETKEVVEPKNGPVVA